MYECLAYYIDLNGIETERLKHYLHIKFKKKIFDIKQSSQMWVKTQRDCAYDLKHILSSNYCLDDKTGERFQNILSFQLIKVTLIPKQG